MSKSWIKKRYRALNLIMRVPTKANARESDDWSSDVLSGWGSKALEAAAMASSTIYKSHVETNLLIYVQRYLHYLLKTDRFSSVFERLPRKVYNAVFNCTVDALVNRETIDSVVARRPSVQVLRVEDSVWQLAGECLQHVREIVPEDLDLRKQSKSMFEILSAVEPHAIELQERFRNGGFNDGCSGRRRKQKWTFELCPQMNWRPKYLSISNTALRYMLGKLARRNDEIKETRDINAAINILNLFLELCHAGTRAWYSCKSSFRKFLRFEAEKYTRT